MPNVRKGWFDDWNHLRQFRTALFLRPSTLMQQAPVLPTAVDWQVLHNMVGRERLRIGHAQTMEADWSDRVRLYSRRD